MSILRHAMVSEGEDIDTILTYISLWSDSAPVLSTPQLKTIIEFTEHAYGGDPLAGYARKVAASHALSALISKIEGVRASNVRVVAAVAEKHPSVIDFFIANSDRVLDLHVFVQELNLDITKPEHLAELPRLLKLSAPLSSGAL